MDEKRFVRTFTKVFKEGSDTYWWLNVVKLIEESERHHYDATGIINRMELTEEDESNILHPKKIQRVFQYCNGDVVGKDRKDPSVSLGTIKAMGKALCNDENAFLIEIKVGNVTHMLQQAEEMSGKGDLRNIYAMMNGLLYDLEVSCYYSFVPGTKEEGFAYYDMKIQEIRREIDNRFWDGEEVRRRLYRLVKEEEMLIKSYSRPGTPKRWMESNLNLRFYDCVFDFVEENPELYQKVLESKTIQFSFYPSKEEQIQRARYFAELKWKSELENTQYSIDRFYQNEVIEAFQKLFREEFGS